MTTNMQHYMDDIHDLLEGLDEEMARRLEIISNFDVQITQNTVTMKQHEAAVFDETKSMTERTEAAHKLAEKRSQIRDLAQQKTELAEKNHKTIEKVYARLNELAWHCKFEADSDNPGCTDAKERAYFRSLDPQYNDQSDLNDRKLLQSVINLNTGNRRRREYSFMTEDDPASTRSGTPTAERVIKETNNRKRPGRPRVKKAHFDKFLEGSNVSSNRSSIEPENKDDHVMISEPKKKKLSNYMKKKQERLRLEEQERARNMLEVKKEVDTGDYEAYAFNQWNMDDEIGSSSRVGQSSSAHAELNEEDEKELLACLAFDASPSPPRGGMMDELDETAVYSMDMYPSDHRSENTPSQYNEFRRPGTAPNYGRGAASSSQSFTQQKSNNATAAAGLTAASSVSDSSIEKRSQRNTLFGSIPETSFSGRPRKLTGRVTEMIISQREKNNNHKKHREQEEWCICNGANTDSEMMVQCDNKDCLAEWFHFDCVDLKDSPVDKWYCPECRELPENALSSRPHD